MPKNHKAPNVRFTSAPLSLNVREMEQFVVGRKTTAPKLKLLEGNPGKRPVGPGVQLPPVAPEEPDWHDWWPVKRGSGLVADRRARAVASTTWAQIVGQLDPLGLLAEIDDTILVDLCICRARIDACERNISADGIAVSGKHGPVKNPAAVAVHQYRTQPRAYISELGLSPAARARLRLPGDSKGGDDLLD